MLPGQIFFFFTPGMTKENMSNDAISTAWGTSGNGLCSCICFLCNIKMIMNYGDYKIITVTTNCATIKKRLCDKICIYITMQLESY